MSNTPKHIRVKVEHAAIGRLQNLASFGRIRPISPNTVAVDHGLARHVRRGNTLLRHSHPYQTLRYDASGEVRLATALECFADAQTTYHVPDPACMGGGAERAAEALAAMRHFAALIPTEYREASSEQFREVR